MKFPIGGSPSSSAVPYNLLWNELVLGDNTVLAEMDGRRVAILNHSVINFINTTDERFNTYMFDTMQNLIKPLTQLSSVGEKGPLPFV
ncbi:MAG: hypothetical protein WDM90_09880 [Ferruginibacter sp.]